MSEELVKEKEYSGEKFNKFVNDNGIYLIKFLNNSEKHNNFQYKYGLNVDFNEFTPHGKCKKGGLYFTELKYAPEFLNFGPSLRLVEIPDEARIYVEEKKFKANKLILKTKYQNIKHFINDLIPCKYKLFVLNEDFIKFFCKEQIINCIKKINFIPEDNCTNDILNSFIESNIFLMVYISENIAEKILYINTCLKAINYLSLFYIPFNLRTYKICKKALDINNENIKHFPFNILKNNQNWCTLFLKYVDFCYLPDDLKTYQICKKALKYNSDNIEYIPFILFSEKISLCFINYFELFFLPDNLKSYNVCKKAVEINADNIEYVPYPFRNKEICSTAINKNGYNLKFIPTKFKNFNYCLKSLKNNSKAIDFVPDKFKPYIHKKN